jgi:ribosome-associated translation inhibitor RaiA
MRIAFSARHLPVTKHLDDLVQRRAQFAFSRFIGHLADVRLRLAGDGPLVYCLATVRLMPGEILAVHGTYSTAESAVADACERMRSRIVRALDRRRQRGRS